LKHRWLRPRHQFRGEDKLEFVLYGFALFGIAERDLALSLGTCLLYTSRCV